MAATPFSTAVSNSLSLVNATTTNADAPRSDPLGPPSRIARRTRRRLPPTPSLAPAGSSLPTIQPNVAAVAAGAPRPGAGRRRLAAPVCCRCSGQGKCKNCVCVKQGGVCINCLPSRVGGCQNLDIPALPSAPSPVPGPPPSASISLPDPPSAASISMPNPPPQPIDHVYAPSPPTTPLQRLPSWDSIFALRCSTLQHVPKGARDVWADLITGVFSAIVDNPSNSDNWRKLFLLPRCVLANPSNGDRLGWREFLTIVRRRIRRWQSGDIVALWGEAVASVSAKSHRGRREMKPEALQASNVRRAKLATQAGQYRKGIQALTSEGLSPASESSLEEMLTKHPQSPPPPRPSTTPPPPISVPLRCVSRALRSSPSNSAPGPSLLRANHLREATRCPTASCGTRALRAIAATVNLLAAGGAPPEIASYLCGATLLAVKKKNGGLRPIAVGEVLRQLTSKCLSRAVQSDSFDVLSPLQVGVGVKGGCEAVIHSVAHILEREDLPLLSPWILLIDFLQ